MWISVLIASVPEAVADESGTSDTLASAAQAATHIRNQEGVNGFRIDETETLVSA
jgi:hypothetical protein